MNFAEAVSLTTRTSAAAKGKGRLSDVIMPDDKPLSDCTGEYFEQVGEAIQALCEQLPGDQPETTTRH
jgi:hypothetical protein